MMQETRRGFITGLGALFVAAPAIVRAASIMPVKAIDFEAFTFDGVPIVFDGVSGWGELEGMTRKAFIPMSRAQIYSATPMMLELQRRWDSNSYRRIYDRA